MNTTTIAHLPTVLQARTWPTLPGGWQLDEDGLSAAFDAGQGLDPETCALLDDFLANSAAGGALMLRGVPVGDVPATPPTPTSAVDKDNLSEFALMVIGRRLGEPVGYAPEHGGDLIQNIVPTASSAQRQVSTSSDVALMFHTEAAFHPYRPRYLLLLCLRGDPSAKTTLAAVANILPRLSPETIETLSQPRFRTAVDESYLHGRSNVLGPPMPVLFGDLRRPTMIFDADLMVGIDPAADAALLAMSAAVDAATTAVTLDAGDLLIVDNDAAVHGRSPYQPRFDGTDRWLQRTFVVDDLAPSAHCRSGRVITTQFGA